MANVQEKKKSVLFVRSGGGMPGLDVHAGIWLALSEFGVDSTACSGTSAGAIVSAFDAWHYGANTFRDIIYGLQDCDVRRERFAWKLRVPWLNSYLHHEPVYDLAWKYFSDLIADPKDIQIWATRCRDGAAVELVDEYGAHLVDAMVASLSISGIFPPVEIAGDAFVDGGVRRNLPLPADWNTYDEVWLLIASAPPESYRKKRGILTNLLRNVGWLMQDQILDVLDHVEDYNSVRGGKVRVLWPTMGHPKGVMHFDHSLIDAAYAYTKQWLNGGGAADA